MSKSKNETNETNSSDDDEDNDQSNSHKKVVTNEQQSTDSENDQSDFDAENLLKTNLTNFLNEIIPKDHSSFICCHLKRHRQGLSTIFSLFFQGQNQDNPIFLLNARKHLTIGGHSEYFLGTDEENGKDLNEKNSIAKLKSMNLTSTQYILYDQQNSSDKNQQTLAIIYDDQSLGEKGPRKLIILIPDKQNESFQLKENETIIDHWKSANSEGLIEIKNRPPTFNEQSEIYTLDLKGSRIKQPSHKNFQLINSDDNSKNNIAMQFGRIDENSFALDYRYPFTAIQAFAIALSSFHNRFRQ